MPGLIFAADKSRATASADEVTGAWPPVGNNFERPSHAALWASIRRLTSSCVNGPPTARSAGAPARMILIAPLPQQVKLPAAGLGPSISAGGERLSNTCP